jgi:hypothetical protein
MRTLLLSASLLLAGTRPASAAEGENRFTTRPSLMAGLVQWTVFGGGNIAAQLKHHRWVLEYSHGQALDLGRFGGFALTEAERDAEIELRMPWTTGGGAGFQITPELHVLLEAKAHRYEVRGFDRNQSLSYTTFTLGPGIFYDIYLWEGLFVQPVVRWWPTLASSYDREGTLAAPGGGSYRHERHDLLPFVNVNLGWTFSGLD